MKVLTSKNKKIITQTVTERHLRNFAECIIIIGGMCVTKMYNLGE